MNPFRAKRIADNLHQINAFHVHNHLHKLQVDYRGQLAFFDSETAFWSFIFRVAQANHEEGAVAEVEALLHG